VLLTRPQHLAAFGVGVFSVAINYPFAYWAEERIVSGVVAVFYAGVAFLNLVAFRLAFGQRAPKSAWMASALGIGGVALLSFSELATATMSERAAAGLALAFGGAAGAAVSNIFARRADQARAPLATTMAWAMLYGAILLALFAQLTGRVWSFEATVQYVGSLLYLAGVSVVAFLLYFGLARRRGYTVAAYILAVTPVIAMTLSTLLESKTWQLSGVAGAALVLFGQWLLLRKQA
jgi:drug/metabolite transporter (DMT)-like permease